MTDTIPTDLIPSDLNTNELNPDTIMNIDRLFGIAIGVTILLIMVAILSTFIAQRIKSKYKNNQTQKIKENNSINRNIKEELNREIEKYQNQIYECCSKDHPDEKDLEYINNRRMSEFNDEKYKLKKNPYVEIELSLLQNQLVFCEDRFEVAAKNFSKIKKLANENNPKINKLLLELLKITGNTQPLFELYHRSSAFKVLEPNQSNPNVEYTQVKNIGAIKLHLTNKYQSKIIYSIQNKKFDEAKKNIQIYKMLAYYEARTLYVLILKQAFPENYKEEFFNRFSGQNIAEYELSDEFIEKFQQILKDEYVYSLVSMRFEYINENKSLRNKLGIKNLGKYWNIIKDYTDNPKNPIEKRREMTDEEFKLITEIANNDLIIENLGMAINNITKTNKKYEKLHCENITQKKFQALDQKNFDRTIDFINKNKIAEKTDEILNPPKPNLDKARTRSNSLEL